MTEQDFRMMAGFALMGILAGNRDAAVGTSGPSVDHWTSKAWEFAESMRRTAPRDADAEPPAPRRGEPDLAAIDRALEGSTPSQ